MDTHILDSDSLRPDLDGAVAALPEPHAAVVWLDHWHALVARRDAGHPAIVGIDRESDREDDYLVRVARAAADCERVMILGPGPERIAFERAYGHLYRRGDRLVDVEASPGASSSELMDRLRFLEGDDLVPAGH